jgi:hypothetical protein
MSLPNLPAGDKFRREVRTEWGGINLNENAGDGELIEAMNMSSREYPLIATEWRNGGIPVAGIHLAPFMHAGKLGYLQKNGTDSYSLIDPQTGAQPVSLSLTDAKVDAVQYAQMFNKLFIFPEKAYYDFTARNKEPMEQAWQSTGHVYFQDGTIYGEPAANNTIYHYGTNWSALFRVGDAVTISGCGEAENNKTAIIREISGAYLRFSENCFADGWWWQGEGSLPEGTYLVAAGEETVSFTVPAGRGIADGGTLRYRTGESYVTYTAGNTVNVFNLDTPTQSTGTAVTMNQGYVNAATVTIKREIPDLDYVCVNENRLWGCKGDTIYASKLGDPLNWNVYDGLSTDSWSVETGTPGEFTGCCSFQGYPTFFKEDCVFRVLGDEPKNFTLRKHNIVGVSAGSNKSIVEIRGRLYYVSQLGAVEWNGGDYPSIISHALGAAPGTLSYAATAAAGKGAIAGTDGIRYFLDAFHEGYQYTWLPDDTYSKAWAQKERLLVYDTQYGTWHELHSDHFGSYRPDFAWDGSRAYMLGHTAETINNTLTDETLTWLISAPGVANGPAEEWYATFADSTRAYKTALTGSEAKKGVLRLLIRCKLAGRMKAWIAYDGGQFTEAGEFGGENGMAKTSRVVPLILRRCDFWQLRLTGTGDAVIYSIAVERYGGEWQQA